MNFPAQHVHSSLGLFPRQPIQQVYECIVQALPVRHYSRRTDEASLHGIRWHLECPPAPASRAGGRRGLCSSADGLGRRSDDR